MDRRGRLTSIDDLEIVNFFDRQSSVVFLDFYPFRRRCDSVVVGKKHLRRLLNRSPNTLVYAASGLQKLAHILFQQSCAPAIIDRRKLFPWDDREVSFITGFVEVGRK